MDMTMCKATVPDTLDLAERAERAIHAMAGAAEDSIFYETLLTCRRWLNRQSEVSLKGAHR